MMRFFVCIIHYPACAASAFCVLTAGEASEEIVVLLFVHSLGSNGKLVAAQRGVQLDR